MLMKTSETLNNELQLAQLQQIVTNT